MQKIANLFSNVLQNLQRHQTSLWRWTTLIVITYFLAKSVTLLVAYKYLPIEAPPRKIPNESSNSYPKEVNTQVIISRNLFDSDAPNRIKSSRVSGSQTIVPSQLPYELVGTIVFQNSRFSMALIRDRSNKQASYYAVGEEVGSARVHKIERYRVVLENGSRLEALELKAAESKLGPISQPIAPSPSGGEEFQSIGENRYVIPQSTVDEVLNNFNVVLTQARMIPNLTNDGKTDGFKVFQIRDGSIYQKLQMKDNDIIKRVNGVELDTFEKATGLFTALRNEKSISIDLVRNGQRINYTYDIR